MSASGSGHPAWLPMAVALVAGAGTTLAVLPTRVPATFSGSHLHVALETADVLVALLAALLVHGRYRSDRRWHQVLLVDALVVLALTNVALATAAGLQDGPAVEPLRWTSVGGRLLGSALLCASALVHPSASANRTRVRSVRGTVGGLAVAGVVVLSTWALPSPVRELPTAPDGGRLLEVHPAVLVAQVVGLGLLGVAAAVLTRRAVVGGDRFTRWLATGTILATFARVHYLLYPSLLSDVVYTGDVLRTGFYACLLAGALQEIEGYWSLRARTAVLDERRRIARDLHDGMAQELTYILAQSRRLAASDASGPRTLRRIEDAAARALDEARRAVETLDREERRPLVEELRGVAADLAGRHEVRIDVDTAAAPAVDTSREATEELLRIVGEAVANAVRHGRARSIRILLAGDGRSGGPRPHRLSVVDDGTGFAPATVGRRRGGGGYGLTSMRERAAVIGGELAVESAPGRGTTVTVAW